MLNPNFCAEHSYLASLGDSETETEREREEHIGINSMFDCFWGPLPVTPPQVSGPLPAQEDGLVFTSSALTCELLKQTNC